MPYPDEPLHKIEGKILRETDRAILMQCEKIDGNDWDPQKSKSQWFPISQVGSLTRGLMHPSNPNLDEPDVAKVKRWILQTKGII